MVSNKKYCLIVVCAVLGLIAKQANGNRETMKECVKKFESKLNNEKYKKLHGNAFKAIDEVNKAANAAQKKTSSANEKNAIKESHQGFIDCIKCVAVAGYITYKANNEVRELCDAKAGRRILRKANILAKETIGIAGVAAYLNNGAATAIAGNYSQQPIKEGIKHITFAGQVAYSGLDVAEQLGALGLDSSEEAKEQGLNASRKALEATGLACYLNLVKSAKIIFGGINKSIPAIPKDNSSGVAAARKSAEALSAIKYINSTAEATASIMQEGPAKRAVFVVKKGIIAAIRGVAAAIQKPIELLNAAQQTPVNEYESLEKSITKAIKQAENDIAYAAANAYQSLGIAAQKIGGENDDKFEKSVMSVEIGRAAAYNSFQNALFEAVQDMTGNAVAKAHPGLQAAVNAILTGAFVAYAELKNAADFAFEILQS